MAITSFPFDGQDTTEDQFSRLFAQLQDTGVAASASASDLKVTTDGSTRTVSIAPGFAYVRGHAFMSTAVELRTMPVPSSGVATHRVVLRLDPAANAITLEVLEGTAGQGAPTLTKQDPSGIHEISLARVQVGAGAVAVTQADIVDERQFSSTRVGTWLGSATRPASPRTGQMGYNVTSGIYEHWNGSSWQPVSDVPSGAIQMYASSDVPAGYLRCDGAIYTALEYPRLAAKLGTTYSIEGDAVGTFRVPNLQGVFPLGANAGHPMGSKGGTEAKSITVDNLPEHDHTIDHDHGKTAKDGKHDHGYRYSTEDGGSAGTFRTGRNSGASVRPGDSGNGISKDGAEHEHVIPAYAGRSGKAGAGVPLDVMPPFLSLNFIVKT